MILTLSSSRVLSQVPVANFTGSPLTGCSPVIVNFQDASSGSPTAWSWDFGNGNSSALQNPTATYLTPGNYTITLTVTNLNGSNTLTRSQLVTVYEPPTVNFTVSQTTGCFPLNAQFTDNSTAGAGNTNTGWLWDFGDGTISTEQNPLHTYSTAGVFTVTLRVTNDKGCSRVLTVGDQIQTIAGISSAFTNPQPSVCQPPATVAFTNSTTGPGTLSYLWDFGDGTTSSLQNPVKTYTTTGLFAVTLITVSSNGCTDTLIKNNLVPVGTYNPSFSSPDSICQNLPVNFVDTSAPVPTSRSWDFGDGTTSTLPNPVKTYSNPGVFPVKLITNYGNCVDSVTRTITVVANPVAEFTAPATNSCRVPLTVNFQNQSANAVSWLWDFGDSTITSTDQNPSHEYTAEGDYTVTLIATNAFGCTDTIVKPAFVRIARPQITIPSLPARECIPFTATFTPSIIAPDGVSSYLWDFGDGATSTQQTLSHTYPVQGTYNVSLTITTNSGCTETLVVTGGVRVGSLPVVDFTAAPIPVCASDPVQFNALAGTDTWEWDFGDGSPPSRVQSPSHIYRDTGTFTVTLLASNSGCLGPARTSTVIVRPPIAAFDFQGSCTNRLEFAFTDRSIIVPGSTTLLWDFGDGTTATVPNPVHLFPALGNYTVSLTATTTFPDGSVCTYTATNTISAIDENPDFSVAPGCKENPATFTALVSSASNIASYTWDFGDGTTTTTSNNPAGHTYANSGDFTVQLTITDINNCTNTIVKNSVVRMNGPDPRFTAVTPTGCQGLTVTFDDQSLNDGRNNITNWQWDFGDGVVQNFSSPPFQHTYNTVGSYTVKLTLTDGSGCSDSLSIPNLVRTSDPLPAFVSSDSLTCPGAVVNFTNNSVADNFTSNWDFGDGTVSADTSPAHSYTSSGSYSIKLFVTDQYGCVDSIVKNSHILVDTPVARFNISDSISSCTPFEVQFTDSSTYAISRRWVFGDGGISLIADPVRYYGQPGMYQVSLTVVSPGGCTDVAYKTIAVHDTAGSVINYNPLTGCNPQGVSFSAFTPGPVTYLWDYGDGNTETTTTAASNHTYNIFGDFVPRVIMQDPSGCLIPLSGTDTIHITGSNAKFGMAPTLLCDSGFVSFLDSTTFNDPITNWSWNFGDGQTSAEQNPVHNYASTGLYTVSLGIQTQSGCTSSYTLTDTIKIVQSPMIAITGDSVACVFTAMDQQAEQLRADTSAVSWLWSFPNGNTSTLQDPSAEAYGTPGNLSITAIATNSSGCRDTATKNILVNPLPTIEMPGTITIVSGESITIPATYTPNTMTWVWAPEATLSCSDCPQPVASPKLSTQYNVLYIDSNGCRNTGSINIVVVCLNGNIFIPNTFSPNGDGSNDIFYPRGKGIDRIQALRIFNRWGELVFEKTNFPVNDPGFGWNGSYKGKPPQPDVYIFQAEVYCSNGDVIKFAGNVSLIQ